MEFVNCVEEHFLRQYVEGHSRELTRHDLLLVNWSGQVTEVSVGEPFGATDHSSPISCKMVMDKDTAGLQVKALNWGKNNFYCIGQELDYNRLFMGKGANERWDAF